MSNNERREGSRRSGRDRRGNDRRLVVDRRFSAERRGKSGFLLSYESPAEHVRNAMQLLVNALETNATITPADFTRLAESALARLSLALTGMEGKPR